MCPDEALIVEFAVHRDVVRVLLLEFLDCVLNGLHSLTWGTHLFGRVVGVTARTVPVTLERLRVQRWLQG